MTFLFQKGSLESKVRRIIEMSIAHSKSLAIFAISYKSLLALLALLSSGGRGLNTAGRPADKWHSALAGAIGGYFMFGSYSGVNYQACRNFKDYVLCFNHVLFRLLCTFSPELLWRAVALLLRNQLNRSVDFNFKRCAVMKNLSM